jgi:hypothetical protein
MRNRFACFTSSDPLSTGPHVTQRFFRRLTGQLLLILAMALVFAAPRPAHAYEGVEIRRALVEASEEGYRLSASYAFELSQEMESTLQYGRTLYFATEIAFTRPRWYWFDEKAIVARQTISLSYNVLTRQYGVAVNGSVSQSFSSMEDALFLIRRPNRWLVAPRGALKQGETYNVTLRMFMDRDRLAKPIQVNAASNSQWRLESRDKKFQYRAE